YDEWSTIQFLNGLFRSSARKLRRVSGHYNRPLRSAIHGYANHNSVSNSAAAHGPIADLYGHRRAAKPVSQHSQGTSTAAPAADSISEVCCRHNRSGPAN